MSFLTPNFLNDPAQYRDAENVWQNQWAALMSHLGQSELWQSPWLVTTYANGQPMLDGDPIFSAASPGLGLGIRVIQLEPGANPREFSIWADKFARDEPDELSVLVISCVLTRETLVLAAEAMTQWATERDLWISQEHHLLSFPRSAAWATPIQFWGR